MFAQSAQLLLFKICIKIINTLACYKSIKMNKNKTLNKIFGILAILILCACVYITLSKLPIALKMNEWQLNFMGDNTYFPVLTIFLLALPALLLLLLIKLLIIKLFNNKLS